MATRALSPGSPRATLTVCESVLFLVVVARHQKRMLEGNLSGLLCLPRCDSPRLNFFVFLVRKVILFA